MRLSIRAIVFAAGLLAMITTGLAGATAVQIEVRNGVKLLTRLHGDALQSVLVKELMDAVQHLGELKPWDFDAAAAVYRLVFRLEVRVPGDPPAIDLFVDIYGGQKRLATVWRIPWRDLNQGKEFGSPQDIATEIMALLKPLFSEDSKALQAALQRKVPVGTGGKVLTPNSIVLALTEQRHKELGRSDFVLRCPQQKNTQLYCVGTNNFVKWNLTPSLAVSPRCLEDDDTGRHPMSPEASKQVLKLQPEDIYLYNFVGEGEYSTFRSHDCQ